MQQTNQESSGVAPKIRTGGSATTGQAAPPPRNIHAMKNLSYCFIVGHVHDELIIEASRDVDVKSICDQMGRSPDWMPDILIRGDGYATPWYKKD